MSDQLLIRKPEETKPFNPTPFDLRERNNIKLRQMLIDDMKHFVDLNDKGRYKYCNIPNKEKYYHIFDIIENDRWKLFTDDELLFGYKLALRKYFQCRG